MEETSGAEKSVDSNVVEGELSSAVDGDVEGDDDEVEGALRPVRVSQSVIPTRQKALWNYYEEKYQVWQSLLKLMYGKW